MSCTTNVQSLSALSPIKLNYSFYQDERLNVSREGLRGVEFTYYDHKGFKNFKDATLSRKNCLVLTDNIALSSMFESSLTSFGIGELGGTFYLKLKGQYVNYKDSNLYVGNTCCRVHNPALVTLSPLQNGTVQLKVGSNSLIQIDENYPFTARIASATEGRPELYGFVPFYKDRLISFKIKTNEGYRFLSAGIDNTLRAVGVELNDTIINPYKFELELITAVTFSAGNLHQTTEVAYYNSLIANDNQTNIKIRKNKDRNTNLLVSCATSDITKQTNVNANLSLLKTNFSSSGTFLPSI